MSKRNFKRKVLKESIFYKSRLNLTADHKNEEKCEENVFEKVQEEEIIVNDINVSQKTLCDKLKDWFIETKPSRRCFRKLLKILNEEGLDVPLSAEKILGKKNCTVIKNIGSGTYCHLGIENQLKRVSNILENYDEIVIDLNVDGIPLAKSSRIQLWPILFKIVNTKETIEVFPVGIYLGKSKPSCVDEFFNDLVEEVLYLKENFFINEKRKFITFRCLVCDTPAKAFVLGVPGHTSTHGCTKCTQKAKKMDDVLTYSSVSGDAISDEDFSNRKYKKHHQEKYLNQKTPLEALGFNMVTQAPLDSMHLIDLGVARKFLMRLKNNKVLKKTSKENLNIISERLLKLKSFVPKEFARKPRPLEDLIHWKATEFRQFLAYTGPSVLKNLIDDDIYYEFILLHCAYRLLDCPRQVNSNLTIAQELLQLFVSNFPIIFGENSVSFNVHSLLHIVESVAKYRVVSNFSAYSFENKLQILKKHVKNHNKILQQIVNKEKDENLFKPEKLFIMSSSPSTSNSLPKTKILKYSSTENCKCNKIFEKMCEMEEKARQQNNILCEILGEHKALLNELLQQNKRINSIVDIFPISSVKGLEDFDKALTAHPELYVRHMKNLLRSNPKKNLCEIITNDIIMTHNLEGTHGKLRFKNFKNVYSRLIEAISTSEQNPEDVLRIAFQKEKKKQFRKASKSKGKENQKNAGNPLDEILDILS